MKRLLFIILCFAAVVAVRAQAVPGTPDFSAVNADGVTLYYNVIDAANRYVEVSSKNGGSSQQSGYNADTIRVPATVQRTVAGVTTTYTVKRMGERCFAGYETPASGKKAAVILPNTITSLETEAFWGAHGLDSLYLPPTITRVEHIAMAQCSARSLEFGEALDSIARFFCASMPNLERLDLSRTSLKRLSGNAIFNDPMLKSVILPNSLEIIENGCFSTNNSLTEVRVPEGVKTIGSSFLAETPALEKVYLPSTLKNIGSGFFAQYSGTTALKELHVKAAVPPATTSWAQFFQNFPTFSAAKLIVPNDATAAYRKANGWKDAPMLYYETIIFKAGTQIRTFYLENENFMIPSPTVTVSLIDGITTSSTPGVSDKANVYHGWGYGILPKQTAVILYKWSAPEDTIYYRADVSATEETVPSNSLMIGTGTEKTFNDPGYTYYIFGQGSQGYGFYYQGNRAGKSIKLRPHQAGLRVPISATPAKSFILDINELTGNTTTGIRDIPTSGKDNSDKDKDVFFDLQGRRVVNPQRGIYIVNGKKVIKN